MTSPSEPPRRPPGARPKRRPAAKPEPPARKPWNLREELTRSLTMLGASVVVVLLIGAGVVAYMFRQGPNLDADSQREATRIVREYAKGYDTRVLLRNGSPGLLRWAKETDVEKATQMFKVYGKVVEVGEPKGQANVNVFNFVKTVSARYDVPIVFEKGRGTYRVLLLQDEGKWKLHGLNLVP